MQPFTPGSLVAGYFRDSGGDTQELSVPQQESAFRSWCSQNGLIPGAIFKDIARPGSSVVGRTGFHDLIHHFRSGQAHEAGLAIWSYSRFARDFDTAQFYRADLRMRGFIFHSLNDEIPEGSIGKLFEAIIDWRNENFLVDLSRDTKRGLHDLVTTYGAVPGTPPRGFARKPVTIGKHRNGQDRIAHRWVPDPEMISRIQQAFAMRANGKTLAEIHTTTHIYSSLNSYNTFFTNKLYIGVMEFGDKVIENYCEPMVDLPTWKAVQNMIKLHAAHKNLQATKEGNANHPRRVNSSYLLSGLVFCARCESPLFGAPSKQRYKPDGTRNADYERYACARSYRRRDCDQGQFPRKLLEDSVINTLKEYVLQPEIVQAHQNQIDADRDELRSHLSEKRADFRNALTGLRRRITNITDAIAETGHTRALLEKLSGLEAEETSLRSQIADLERQADAIIPTLTHDQLETLLSGVREIFASSDLQAQQRILRGFIDKIVVDRDGNKILGVIYYYMPSPLNHSPPEDDPFSVAISLTSLGAPLHRHRFTVSFSATMRTYNKKRS